MSESLSLRDLGILILIVRRGKAKAYDIVEEMGLAPSTVYSALMRMTINGLLEKNDSIYYPTKRAYKLLREIFEELQTVMGLVAVEG